MRRLVYSSKSKGSATLIIAWALPSGQVGQLSCVVAVDVVAMIVVLWLPLVLVLSSFALLVLGSRGCLRARSLVPASYSPCAAALRRSDDHDVDDEDLVLLAVHEAA